VLEKGLVVGRIFASPTAPTRRVTRHSLPATRFRWIRTIQPCSVRRTILLTPLGR